MDFKRLSGLAGVAFVALVVVFNIAIGSTAKPGGAAAIADIAGYYTDHGGITLLVSVVAPFIWLALPLFAVGVLITTSRTSGTLNPWGVVGVVGAIMQNAVFTGVVATDTILAARVDTLAAGPQFTQALWDVHNALFTLNGASLTLALGGFSLAVLTSGAAGRWIGGFGLVGAGLLFAGSLLSSLALAGSNLPMIGLPGFIIWLLWIASYGVRMVRMDAVRQAPAAST